MPSINSLRDLDSRVWSTATWALPFVVQLVLGAMFIVLWLLGKVPPFTTHSAYEGERAWFISGAAVTMVASAVVSGLLLTSRSPCVRGVALSAVGSGTIVLIGSIVYAIWELR
ncbi:hypothetical protein BMW24_021610 [Mycobacterium heckeshornense]|nr:hypothetical protein BMW24_021610 [Mycobacterium heckeshornense]